LPIPALKRLESPARGRCYGASEKKKKGFVEREYRIKSEELTHPAWGLTWVSAARRSVKKKGGFWYSALRGVVGDGKCPPEGVVRDRQKRKRESALKDDGMGKKTRNGYDPGLEKYFTPLRKPLD